MNKQERNNKIIYLEKQITKLKEEIRILTDDIKSIEGTMQILEQTQRENNENDNVGLLQNAAVTLSIFNQQLRSKKSTYSSIELEIKQLNQKNDQVSSVIGYCLLISAFIIIYIIPYFLFEYLPEWIFLIIGIFALLFCGKSGNNRYDKGTYND